jgi:hypothetical protein
MNKIKQAHHTSAALWLRVWTKNTIFAVYSEKFRKIPISLKSRIRTQYLMGKQRRTLQKCLSKIYSENRIFAKNDFRGFLLL